MLLRCGANAQLRREKKKSVSGLSVLDLIVSGLDVVDLIFSILIINLSGEAARPGPSGIQHKRRGLRKHRLRAEVGASDQSAKAR